MDYNLSADGLVAFNHGIARLGLTDMSTMDQGSTCTLSTDVCAYDGPYESTGAGGQSAVWWQTHVGLAKCDRTSSVPNACDRWHIFFDEDSMDGLSTDQLKSLGCHEVGHTVGLKHAGGHGCMISGISTVEFFLAHNIDHINGKY